MRWSVVLFGGVGVLVTTALALRERTGASIAYTKPLPTGVHLNHHTLARRFGLFDRFFTNAEVSSQGHIWSTAAYVTDYGEKLVPSMYSDRRGSVDGEEIDEPESGFLWTLAKKRGITFRDYGEMVTGPQGWPTTQRDLGPDISPTGSLGVGDHRPERGRSRER